MTGRRKICRLRAQPATDVHERIDSACAPGWYSARRCGHGREQSSPRDEHNGIRRRDAEEHTLDESHVHMRCRVNVIVFSGLLANRRDIVGFIGCR
jgi:hypothetical protein